MDADQLHRRMSKMVQNCITHRVPVCRNPWDGSLAATLFFA